LPYVVTQLVAAVACGLFARLAFGSLGGPTELGLPMLEDGMTVVAGIALEGVGVFVRCSSSLYSSFHFETRPRVHAAIVGVALFVPTTLIGPYTGAAFNPAMSPGSAVTSGDLSEQYLYLAAAALGVAAAVSAFGVRSWKGRFR
jgi:glycerol uptake facilitator-like aquaporin